ncbi:MAG: hypothetical protein WDW38_010687 [Sanguina aurantia]
MAAVNVSTHNAHSPTFDGLLAGLFACAPAVLIEWGSAWYAWLFASAALTEAALRAGVAHTLTRALATGGLSLQDQAALAMRLHGGSSQNNNALHLGGMGQSPGQGGILEGGSSSSAAGGDGDPNENPPVGCNPDAIKLFIGNVPKSFTEEQLCPFFETAGQVKELVIIRDKATQESKGSAFVWYATRAQAERAILEFNLRHVLPDATGQHDRPLVVRRAKSRSKGLGGPSTSIHPAMAMLTQASNNSYMDGNSLASAGFYSSLAGVQQQQQLMQQMMAGGGSGLDGLNATHLGHQAQMLPGGGLMGYNARGSSGIGPNYSSGLLQSLGIPRFSGASQHSVFDNLGLSDPLLDPYSGLVQDNQPHNHIADQLQMQQNQQQLQQAQAAQQQQLLLQQQSSQSQQLALPLSPMQLSAVSNHLFSLQAVTGAQLHISSGAPNMFTLLMVGNITQIHSAWNLVTSIISGLPSV